MFNVGETSSVHDLLVNIKFLHVTSFGDMQRSETVGATTISKRSVINDISFRMVNSVFLTL